MQAGKRPRTGPASVDLGIRTALDEYGSFPLDLQLHGVPRQQLAELFSTLDRDGDGLLRPSDLPRCWEQVSAQLDTTGVGEISPRQFVVNLQRLALARPYEHAAYDHADKQSAPITLGQLAARVAESLNTALLGICMELRALAMESRYVRGPVIGEGSFSVVRRATDCTDGQTFALKLVLKSSTTNVEFASELAVLRKIGRHKRLAGIVESWENRDSWALLLDLTSGREVFDAIAHKGSFSEADAAALIRQLCDALSYIHGLGVIHRDIKPENVLLRESHVSCDISSSQIDCVLCDFGLAATVPAQGCVGTTHYMCPEMFKDAPYSTAVDMFATGVLLFNLLSGTQPFDASGGLVADEVVQGNIEELNWGFNGEGWSLISTEARQLITNLLVRDPIKRPSASELLSNCRWVQGDAAPRWVSTSNAPTKSELRILTAVYVFSAALHRTTTESLEEFNKSRRVWRAAAYACALVVGLSDGNSTTVPRSTIATNHSAGHSSTAGTEVVPPWPTSGGNRLSSFQRAGELLQTDVDSRAAGVRAAFDAIDTDCNGLLSHSELRHVISGLLGPETPESEIEHAVNAAFARLDKDMDGSISFDEFSAVTAPFSRDTLRSAFNLFDTDHNGSITMNEFTAMLHRLGLFPPTSTVSQDDREDMQSNEVKTLFQAADKDRDGSVSFEEFVSLLPIVASQTKDSNTRRRQQRLSLRAARHSQNVLAETFKLATVQSITN